MEHLDVGPCGEDDAVNAKDAEDDVVSGDEIEPSDKFLEPPWWSPVSADVCMRGTRKAGCVKFVDW